MSNGRTRIFPKLVEFVAAMQEAFPEVRKAMEPVDTDTEPETVDPLLPETMSIPLPSRFSRELHRGFGIVHAAKIERTLREGQAFDALEDVRLNILSWSINSRLRFDEIHGQYASTRHGAFLRGLMKSARRSMRSYNVARDALLKLGLSESSTTFQPLEKNQLWIKDPSKPRKPGDTAIEDPWYWRAGMPDNLTAEAREDWMNERKCIKSQHFSTLLR